MLIILLKWFKENEQDADYLMLSHLHGVELRNDDIEAFLIKWEEIIHRMRKVPGEDELLHLFRAQIRRSEKMKIHFMEFERIPPWSS